MLCPDNSYARAAAQLINNRIREIAKMGSASKILFIRLRLFPCIYVGLLAAAGRDAEKATESLRAAADAVSGRVAAAMSGQHEAEVVELKKSPA